MRMEPLEGEGMLIVATASPLPADTEDNRRRFARLHAALISRAETPANKRGLLGYFYREAPAPIGLDI